MGSYDELDLNNEDDQKRLLRKIGKVKANTMVGSPADFAKQMGMSPKIIQWLEDNYAYFLIEVRVDCQ